MTRRRSIAERRRRGWSVADGGGGLGAAGPEALPTDHPPMPSLTPAMCSDPMTQPALAVSGTACPPSSCARYAATLVAGYAGTRATDATVRVAPGARNRPRQIDA